MSSHSGSSKKRKWPWILGGFVVLIVIVASCGGGNSTETGSSSAAPAAPGASSSASAAPSEGADDDAITYELTGAGSVTNITYSTNGSGGQRQITKSTKVPWSVTAPADTFGFYSLIAQRSGSDGETSCRIKKGDEVIAESSSEGPYAVVSCNGS